MKSKYFKPEDFDWFVRKQSSIMGFTKELADYCNERIIDPEWDALVEEMVAALRYNKNEMGYRLYQIEGGYQIPMVGEMYTAIKKADEVLAKLEAFKEKEK